MPLEKQRWVRVRERVCVCVRERERGCNRLRLGSKPSELKKGGGWANGEEAIMSYGVSESLVCGERSEQAGKP